MKWALANDGDERICEGFLWLPNGTRDGEYRWLEYARWRERHDGYNWRLVKWLDEVKAAQTAKGSRSGE